MTSFVRVFTLALFMLGIATAPARSAGYIVLQSTTSTENSGLFTHLLPLFTKKTGIEVRVVAVGTGQAIKNARNGDGDVLLVHDTASEQRFVVEGWGVQRYDLMFNDFILVGPSHDPADVAGEKDVVAALKRVAGTKAPFVSRGAALNTAIGMDGYALTDRATWSAFKNRSDHALMVEGDKRLFNQYGVILVNPAQHPNVRAAEGQTFIDWLISKEGQEAIAAFQITGEQQFFPNATR